MRPERTRVLVIGGGPVGLVVSALLSQRGVENVVVERRRESQRAPAAHVLRKRPLAILAALGVADEVRRAAPPLPLDFVTWCTTLGGPEVGRLALRPLDPATGERGPEPWTNCAQNVLEPILRRRAAREPAARIVHGAECIGVEQRGGRVRARLRRADGEHVLEADWAVAADGAASPVRRMLGIPLEGIGPLARFWMVHFEADLLPWVAHRSGPLFWILNPESPGCLIVHDPKRSHVFMMPRLAVDTEEATIPARLAAALAVPVEPRLLAVDSWSPHVQLAARYREGRVFLVGDAAHRFPPTGGLGLNTGIEEAHALAERLAAVVAGGAPEVLLDGYEPSCRPAARANADESFENLRRLGEITSVLGACADLASLERRLASLGPAERRALAKAIERQRSHFESGGCAPRALEGAASFGSSLASPEAEPRVGSLRAGLAPRLRTESDS